MQSNTSYRGKSPLTGEGVEVVVAGGRIAEVREAEGSGLPWISPGWIDVQVNGFGGVDYNDPDTTFDEISRSIEVQRKTGVTRLLPTVITGDLDRMAGCLVNLRAAQLQLPAIAGFHIEGPWISPNDGPRGAHPREHVRPASVDEFKRLHDAAEGHLRLLTLAPESPGALALIEHAISEGVTVAIGHTGASVEQIDDAVGAGATMSTHLGNGAHSELPKFTNYVLRQMADDRLTAGLIVDGIHLSEDFVRVAVRTKGIQRTVLVTDAVAPAGCEPGPHRLGELDVTLSEDGKVQLANGRLAGSSLSMDRAIANVRRQTGISLGDALAMATVTPGNLLALERRRGFLEPGDLGEFVLFEETPSGDIDIVDVVV